MYVSGVPDPTSTSITWFKVGPGGNKTELKEPTVNFSSDHRTLLLSNVQDSDGGVYGCAVSLPSHPTVNVTMYINITGREKLYTKNEGGALRGGEGTVA